MFDNRKYVVIPAEKINEVDFSQVHETSAETCRYSLDGTKTFIKYDGDMPSSVAAIEGISKEYTYEEFQEVINHTDWRGDYRYGSCV